jgi:cephalosporin hydroxylase
MEKRVAQKYHDALVEEKYAHRFSWLGVPIIQEPQDIVAVQELIWKVKPDLIIETGIAHGGSLVLSASMLSLLGGERTVVGVDIDIRKHTKEMLATHPMRDMITTIESDSTKPSTVDFIREVAMAHRTIMVLLDSNHTHKHVLAELKAYAPLVSIGSYCVVFDTGIEDLPYTLIDLNRPWGKGNNPKTAVHEFLKDNIGFVIDKEIEEKLIITSSPDGWLKRVW